MKYLTEEMVEERRNDEDTRKEQLILMNSEC